ncbi:hypothetical protein KYK30_08230 [Shinella yambaruensis]|uniref:Uncharacterized protein n=1 Tax=Shinella yambaruensis TaxID=415996 RepID=A0ABQ5ZNA2_9HYPH|nr:hypothetical protein [Shinella yambaruensis]MCJ8025584.1 hypothetical protein [Shinella yambaruensis]MCU7979676.1 hypothetical protein [Shinella yambaruensis]GLR53135.1 hypothetical protein GCM10007923_43500 [Shinella yambaruensis]
MIEEAATWHYAVAFVFFLLVGAIGHVCRAVFNVFPDRLFDRTTLDLVVSDGYDWNDRIFAGYYRLDFWRNFRNATVGCGLAGLAVMLFSDGASGLVARGIETALAWLWDLFLYRLETIRWL